METLRELSLRGCHQLTAAGVAQLAKIPSLRSVSFPGNGQDSELVHLLPFLEQFSLEDVTDAALNVISNMQKVSCLCLWNCSEVTPTGLTCLGRLRKLQILRMALLPKIACETIEVALRSCDLLELALQSCDLSAETLRQISRLTNLLELSLAGSVVTSDGLAHLVGLENLTVLDLQRTAVTHDDLLLLTMLSDLEQLNVSFCENITDDKLVLILNT